MSSDRSLSENIFWHQPSISREKREAKNNHCSTIIWFTGLSGSGKSTLAHAVERELYEIGYRTFVFDGDNVRHGLCDDLGFSESDRTENIRRIAHMSKLFIEAGIITLTAFISPFREDRQRVRKMLDKPQDFIEIYCKCPIKVCESRDVKGLYKKARKGEISNFTGISSPYEEPINADIILPTEKLNVNDCVTQILGLLKQKEIIPSSL